MSEPKRERDENEDEPKEEARVKCDVCDGEGQHMAWGRWVYGIVACVQCSGAGYIEKTNNA